MRFEIPLIVFEITDTPPIQGVPNTVPGVCYRSGPKGWMDTGVFEKWICEKRRMSPLSTGKESVLFADNASDHKKTGKAIAALNSSFTKLEVLPKNVSDLFQPADAFKNQKLWILWRRILAEKKLEMIRKNAWVDWKSGYDNIPNSGKTFYLNLAVSVIREVGNEKEMDGTRTFEKI